MSEVACTAPVGDGVINVTGSIKGPFSSRDYDLTLTARDLPIQSLVALARHAKQGVPDDLIAAGRLNGNVKLQRDFGSRASGMAWKGSGETSGFDLRSKLNKTELVLGKVPFVVSSATEGKFRATLHEIGTSTETHLDIGPFSLALGRPASVSVGGWASRSGYSFEIQGEAQVPRLLQAARMVGISAPQPAADGFARIDLQIGGAWSGFADPRALGKAQLHSVRAEVRGVNAPLEIASATLLLMPDQVTVQNVTASIADTSWHGSLVLPRQCALPESCPVHFDLHTDEVATDRLNQLFNPHVRQQPWYRFLSSPAAGVPYLLTVHATGKLTANRVVIHKLVGNRVSANVELNKGKLRLSDVRGDVLGGRHTGEWEGDFTAKPPEYSGSGTLERVELSQLSERMKDDWITGTATGTYRVKASGLDAGRIVCFRHQHTED